MSAPQFIRTPPCVLQGAPSPVQATGRTLRWGVVATGRIAARVTEDIARLEDAVLQAVSSRSEATAVEFAHRFGFAASYYDDEARGKGYRQLFADPEVDVVYIASPHAQHYELTREALEAGKHVLCEKSITINAAELADLIEVASRRGRLPDGGRLDPVPALHQPALGNHLQRRAGRDPLGAGRPWVPRPRMTPPAGCGIPLPAAARCWTLRSIR